MNTSICILDSKLTLYISFFLWLFQSTESNYHGNTIYAHELKTLKEKNLPTKLCINKTTGFFFLNVHEIYAHKNGWNQCQTDKTLITKAHTGFQLRWFIISTGNKYSSVLTGNNLLIAHWVLFKNPRNTSPNAPSPILYSSLKPLVAWLSSLLVKLWVPTRATAMSMSHFPSLAREE